MFLTGATGFVGKAVLAKLLQGDIGLPQKISLLVRAKRGISHAQRIKTLFESPAFEKARKILWDQRSLSLDDIVA